MPPPQAGFGHGRVWVHDSAALGSAGITGQARWKAMWVARTTVNASVPAASGRAGLGMGRSDATFRANFVRDTLNDDWER